MKTEAGPGRNGRRKKDEVKSLGQEATAGRILKEGRCAAQITELPDELKEVMNGNSVFVWRDDLRGGPLGGSKGRFFDICLEDYRERGCGCLVTYGSENSDMTSVSALRCAMAGIPCTAIIKTKEEPPGSCLPSLNLAITKAAGAEMVYCKRKDVRDTVREVLGRKMKEGQRPCYVYGDETGTGNRAAQARVYAGAFEEVIKEDERRRGCPYDIISLPAGTGGTMAGLVAGRYLHPKERADILGISVHRPVEDVKREVMAAAMAYGHEYCGGWSADADDIKALIHVIPASAGEDAGAAHRDEALSETGGVPQMDGENKADKAALLNKVRMEDAASRKWPVRPGAELTRMETFILQVFGSSGIPLDPIYTGKALWSVSKYLREENITGKRILFIHTGGIPVFADFLKGVLQRQYREDYREALSSFLCAAGWQTKAPEALLQEKRRRGRVQEE